MCIKKVWPFTLRCFYFRFDFFHKSLCVFMFRLDLFRNGMSVRFMNELNAKLWNTLLRSLSIFFNKSLERVYNCTFRMIIFPYMTTLWTKIHWKNTFRFRHKKWSFPNGWLSLRIKFYSFIYKRIIHEMFTITKKKYTYIKKL